MKAAGDGHLEPFGGCALVLVYTAVLFTLSKNVLVLFIFLKWTLGYLHSSLNASCTPHLPFLGLNLGLQFHIC